jgi:acyl phosphate:glycerol-3-phosphate acyltransferase
MLRAVAVVAICYLIGSIPFPLIVSQLVKGIDLRQHGSGNMGATNAARVLGKQWFAVVFGLDFIKGAAATLLAQQLLPGHIDVAPVVAASVGAFFAVLGHCFPVFVGFKGGVGLAASAGALVIINSWLLVAVGTTILVLWKLSRNMYVGTAAAAAIAPAWAWLLWQRLDVLLAVSVWAALVVFVHMKDVRAWWAGRNAA